MPLLDDFRWVEISVDLSRLARQRPAVFLDRDGVVIVEKHYLRDPGEVELYPGVVEKIRALHELNLPIVLVTNQSGIGQGLFGWIEFESVHRRMLELIGLERPFAATYANGHHPAETNASWRKPNPGMILQAAADLSICLGSSLLVGDKLVDLQAAARGGIPRLVHVESGHGVAERPKVIECFPGAELIGSLADLSLDRAWQARNESMESAADAPRFRSTP